MFLVLLGIYIYICLRSGIGGSCGNSIFNLSKMSADPLKTLSKRVSTDPNEYSPLREDT